MALFAGAENAYGTHGTPTKKPDTIKWIIRTTAVTKRGKTTAKMWEDHLDGKRPLGIICIREDATCMWGCIDYDVYGDDLTSLILKVKALKFPLLPCRSKSGGLHLYIFFKKGVPAEAVQSALQDMAAQLGIADSEIFPKQTAVLVDRGDAGNWMVMPYYGDTYGGKIQEQVGLEDTGAEMHIAKFISDGEGLRITDTQLDKLTRKRGGTDPGQPKTNRSQRGKNERNHPVPDGGPNMPFADGPPCLQTLAYEKVQRGGQNNALMQMGIYYKLRNPEHFKEDVEMAAREYLDPPGSSEGTNSTIKSLQKKDYKYMCRAEPMRHYCNTALCRSRTFGIGEADDYPRITSLARLETEPPIWFASIGGKRLQLSTDELLNYVAFVKASVNQHFASYQSMRQSDWALIVKAALDGAEEIPIPEDATETGRFLEYLEDFLTNQQAGEKPDDLFVGRPFKDDERQLYVFRIRDLQNFLIKEGMKEWSRSQLGSKLLDIGCKDESLDVSGRRVQVWTLSVGRIQQIPETTTPSRGESTI